MVSLREIDLEGIGRPMVPSGARAGAWGDGKGPGGAAWLVPAHREALGGLSRLTDLRVLSLAQAGPLVDDRVLELICAGCTALEALDLNGTAVCCVVPLAGLVGLMDLGLAHTRVGDDSLEALALAAVGGGLPKLASLTLRGTGVGSRGVACLLGGVLPRLRLLNLVGTPAASCSSEDLSSVETLQQGIAVVSIRR
ncbi:unnamed protein product [Discosporangium mesarthrocarpum]